ncbi:MAG TPA: NUDIX domain-containing protein, partial [Urbifossiella sp.]
CIWISEVMLQQTTVAAVVPYFTRFLAAFPTVRELAAADEQQVLKLWEGLGYYRRARHLHAAAKLLAAEHPEQLPDDPAVWSELPGVGRYILGAVLSQAFDRRFPIVEANSLRVLARLFGYRGDPRIGAGQKWLWSAAESLLPVRRVGDFNQALMELGALVCTIASPGCAKCPLAAKCIANRDGLQTAIPLKKASKEIAEVREVAIVIRAGGKILLGRRPADASRWQNMWEVPHGEITVPTSPPNRDRQGAKAPSERSRTVAAPHLPAETLALSENRNAAVRIARELIGLDVAIGDEIGTIRHGVTRFAISMHCFEARRLRGRLRSSFYAELRWVAIADLANYPVSSPQRKLMTMLKA